MRLRWAVESTANPYRAHLSRQGLVRVAARGDEDFAIPVLEDFDGKVGRCAEAEEPDALATLDTGDAQAAEPDDAGAEQRREVLGRRAIREGNAEIGSRDGVLGR